MIRFILTVSFRNMLRQRRRSFLTFFLLVISYLLVSVSLSIGEGSYSLIIKNFTSNYTGHVRIQKLGYNDNPSAYALLDDYKNFYSVLESNEKISAWTPRILSAALAYSEDKTAPTQIIGIDYEREKVTTNFLKDFPKDFTLDKRDKDFSPVIISKTLQKRLKLKLEDEIVLIGSGYDGSIANDIFRVAQILEHEDFIGPWTVIMSLEKADEFLSLNGQVHQIIVMEKKFETAKKIQRELRESFKNRDAIEILSWEEVAKEFYQSMIADKKGNKISLLVIILMAILTVLNTVLMAVLERVPEFGLLRAIGTKSSVVVSLILTEVFFLASFACTVGLFFSYFVNLWFVKIGVQFPEAFEVGGMRFDRMTGEISWYTLGWPFGIVLLSCLVASLYPAAKAISQDPVASLRSK